MQLQHNAGMLEWGAKKETLLLTATSQVWCSAAQRGERCLHCPPDWYREAILQNGAVRFQGLSQCFSSAIKTKKPALCWFTATRSWKATLQQYICFTPRQPPTFQEAPWAPVSPDHCLPLSPATSSNQPALALLRAAAVEPICWRALKAKCNACSTNEAYWRWTEEEEGKWWKPSAEFVHTRECAYHSDYHITWAKVNYVYNASQDFMVVSVPRLHSKVLEIYQASHPVCTNILRVFFWVPHYLNSSLQFVHFQCTIYN